MSLTKRWREGQKAPLEGKAAPKKSPRRLKRDFGYAFEPETKQPRKARSNQRDGTMNFTNSTIPIPAITTSTIKKIDEGMNWKGGRAGALPNQKRVNVDWGLCMGGTGRSEKKRKPCGVACRHGFSFDPSPPAARTSQPLSVLTFFSTV